MNDIRFETTGPGYGQLYINGVLVPGVVSIEPELFARHEFPSVLIRFSVRTFTVTPAIREPDCPIKAAGLRPEDFK